MCIYRDMSGPVFLKRESGVSCWTVHFDLVFIQGSFQQKTHKKVQRYSDGKHVTRANLRNDSGSTSRSRQKLNLGSPLCLEKCRNLKKNHEENKINMEFIHGCVCKTFDALKVDFYQDLRKEKKKSRDRFNSKKTSVRLSYEAIKTTKSPFLFHKLSRGCQKKKNLNLCATILIEKKKPSV